jgi:acetyltransferase
MQRERPPLADLLAPRTVAVIGADGDPGSIGRTVLANLLANPFGGTVFPVDPRHPSLLGVRTFPSLAAIPERIDLAVIAMPAPAIPGVVAECVAAGVKGAAILSAGFAGFGAAGADLARHTLEAARRGGLRLFGPDSLGIMNPVSGLNATFSAAMAKPGGIAFLSQSGAMCTAILDWSRHEGLGFSGVVSLGEMIDVGWHDLIDHFGQDPHTRAIVIHLEEFGDARSFLSAAREVAMAKPIIAITGGRAASAARARAARAGAPAEADELFDALLARAGVLRVETIAELFGAADLLGNQPCPRGRRLAIVTNAGGPAALAADAVAQGGSEIACLAPATIAALDAELPAQWSHGDPIDVLGDATPERFATAIRLALADPGCDGVLAMLSPHGMTDATRTAELVVEQARLGGKPVFASWMGGPAVEGGRALFGRAGIPAFDYPELAARAWNTLCAYGERLRLLYETPRLAPSDGQDAPDRAVAGAIIAAALADDRTVLGEAEAVRLLEAYHLRVDRPAIAGSAQEAVQHAERLGYPVVVETHRHDPTARDGAALCLGVDSGDAVRTAFHAIRNVVQSACGAELFQGVSVHPPAPGDGCELSLSMAIDPRLGPVMTIGPGGPLAEVYHDRAHGLPPLTSVLARRMLDQVRMVRAFIAARAGRAIDPEALAQVLVRFSQLVAEQPRLKSVTIDPLVVVGGSVAIGEVRVELHDPALEDRQLPRPAVRPYPAHYRSTTSLRDGTAVVLRPVRAEDEPAFVRLHQQLSERTVRFRYAADLPLDERIAHARLARICHVDYDREIALVVELAGPDAGGELIGVGRLSRIRESEDAEMRLLVADRWQNRGLGAELLAAVVEVAKAERIRHLKAAFLPENRILRKLLTANGFIVRDRDDPLIHAELALR